MPLRVERQEGHAHLRRANDLPLVEYRFDYLHVIGGAERDVQEEDRGTNPTTGIATFLSRCSGRRGDA